MVQGTTSDAGKSALVVGLCRALYRRGVRVAPFKPQNMALNSAVTADGGEMGRAQALQAEACGLLPHTDMNPVLIKPNTDIAAQIIVQGQAQTDMDAAVYQHYKQAVMPAVMQSFSRLVAQYEVVIVEGAGSPAEINLRENDIANMGFAEQADCPVILIADIDRGGVFAHLVGTLALLSESEQSRIKGFVINRFRGDLSLLQPGLDWLEQRTAKPVLGVLPYLHNLQLDAEDSITPLDKAQAGPHRVQVVVPVLPRISNHTDFDPLRHHSQIDLHYVHIDAEPPPADLMILPGSKNVRQDLHSLMTRGWQQKIARHLRYGGHVLGICGGFQMLGQVIDDPAGIEGEPGQSVGLQLLELQTRLHRAKTLRNIEGSLMLAGERVTVSGYEIHAGLSEGRALQRPLIDGGDWQDGALSADGQIAGTYLHGLFERAEAIRLLIQWLGVPGQAETDYAVQRDSAINRMADAVEQHLDLQQILHLIAD